MKSATKDPKPMQKMTAPPAGKFKTQGHEFDSTRPKRQVMSRYSK